MEDPFVQVQKEVNDALSSVNDLLCRWRELANGGDPDEFDWTTNELKTSCKQIDWDLDDLQDVIDQFDNKPSLLTKHKLTSSELEDRKAFVNSTRKQVAEFRDEATNPRSRGQVQSRQKANLLGGGARSKYQKLRDEEIQDNDRFIEDQAQRQDMIMREQDEEVQDLGHAVSNIREMGLAINDELDEQADMLDDLETDMDSTSQKLMAAIKKIDNVLHISRDKNHSCAICIMFIVLIILMAIYFQ